MTEAPSFFPDEVVSNKGAETVSPDTVEIRNDSSSLSVRLRGCFITSCELSSPRTSSKVDVLHADSDIRVPKLTASHVMSPVGPSEGVGGQHGFPRWVDYHAFAQNDGPNGERRIAFQAKRSDIGLGLTKVFELTDGASLTSDTTVYNSESNPMRTSLGEHYYFALAQENPNGLTVNGQTLDQLLGENAESDIMNGKPYFWPSFDGHAEINFPAGYSIQLSAAFIGDPESKMGMLVWHRPGSPSICFEPTVGFDATGQNDGVELPPYSGATLSSRIELL